MAYPYPSGEGGTSSTSLVNQSHQHHGPGHGHGHSISRGDVSRKASEGDSDVLLAFKVSDRLNLSGNRADIVKKKIEEDEAYINFFQDR